ncbi:ribosomal-protein-alanine acetyltransferase [Marvinbryantia formatexigens DSM 14469]|uniref:[Ribosomal protein bS18]-alanine N-acetyltransferase n=1 Tax=Marvinbryantia formatexigens DSM 14469 TaxID=478749 RepID=C6LIV8_9FIRM|nr:ribosomal protein S18-alanine N-acetyltransferase [Marvinbryantia formatexigens]EET59497.1 ribosomal-protein-alanine acetyltransferase [Marvinbryantia formatexigens DSM 14469]UWO24026.1 ribosomal protein S18-alanine N-acetyltransferase [Marvinbryantia formatexigens DSM 14469]SDG66174.1 ribosomal-protein-alanine N-acetyltransferase [Marvinbryantia formatexigens]
MIEITEMQPENLATVAAIEKTIFSQPWSEKGFAASLQSKDTLYLMAWLDGEPAGYCGLLQSFDEADITNVAVKEECRRRKVAETMLTELIRRGAQRGIRAYTLEVRRSNAGAIALYEKLGFTSCGIRRNFYEKPAEDAVIMWKR